VIRRALPLLTICALVLGTGLPAGADALVVTRAMKASTIAEVFIEDDAVRVELEIGLRDLRAFVNILPADLQEKLGPQPGSIEERLERFFAEGFVVSAEGGAALAGTLVDIEPRRRVPRDEIVGLPAAVAARPGEEIGELVLFARLRYALSGRPATLSLRPPVNPETGGAIAEIGFIAYHLGVAINDFRYLGQAETVDLDWDDAWFSRFRNRNLWRRYDAPLSAFLYVDPFEVRQEMVLRPKDLQQWVDLGLEGKEIIPVADQAALKQKVLAFLTGRNPLRVDGEPVEPVLDRIRFVRRSLRKTGVVDPPEDLPVSSATLGVIFVHPVDGLPQTASVKWTLFAPKFPRVPGIATDEAGGLPAMLTAEDPVLVWRNFLKRPTLPTLQELPPPQRSRWSLPLVSLLALLLTGVGLWKLLRTELSTRARGRMAGLLVLLLAATIALWPHVRVEIPSPFGGTAAMDEAGATRLMTGLLANVYHAFDYRGEEKIYDTLAHSTAGDVLSQVYLDTQRALALQNQGGARVKIKKVDVEKARVQTQDGDGGFMCQCTWTATGSVGHWGHIHQRSNRYEANLTIRPMDGTWKITAIELLDEERL